MSERAAKFSLTFKIVSSIKLRKSEEIKTLVDLKKILIRNILNVENVESKQY